MRSSSSVRSRTSEACKAARSGRRVAVGPVDSAALMTKPLPILVLLAACATASPANVEQALRLAAADDSLRTLVDAFADSSRAPSLSIAIARDDRVIFAYARGASASIHTQYRIGSVSKLLTATAAVRLAARHHLDLDAEIHQYVPEFPPKP